MMTPDIPAVELGAMLTRRKRSPEDDASSTTESLDFEHEKWTDDEDGLLQGVSTKTCVHSKKVYKIADKSSVPHAPSTSAQYCISTLSPSSSCGS